MSFRSFVDSAGTTWQVWDIVPFMSERRSDQRREGGAQPPADQEVELVDRRHDDRRVTQARRALLRGTYASGWLCFESRNERRRLSPIPPDWASCSVKLLETYVRHAEPVQHGTSATGRPLGHEDRATNGG